MGYIRTIKEIRRVKVENNENQIQITLLESSILLKPSPFVLIFFSFFSNELLIILLPPFYVVRPPFYTANQGKQKSVGVRELNQETCRSRFYSWPAPKFSPALLPDCYSTGCSNISYDTALFPIVLYFFYGHRLSSSCSSNVSASLNELRLSENLQLCTCFSHKLL